MSFSLTVLIALIYGSLAASAAGGVLLLVLLAFDLKNKRTW